jgi:16S rRNA C967 or C1407 C5-methylase (RsmB/RsmF family)
MEPEAGERILDLCAAPGNKTAQLAVALGNRGTVVANDRDINRLKALRRTLDRLGLLNVSVVRYDGANMPSAVGTFDRVLVDAPCSCEGTTRKRADGWEPEAGGWDDGLEGVQRALLRRGVRLCRPGGLVAYATCTYAPEENEAVVEDVIADLSDRLDLTLTLESARIDGLVSSPGITEWQGRAFRDGMARAMRIWPHQNDTGGFFVALIRKGETS